MDPPASKASLTSGMIVIKEEKIDSYSAITRHRNAYHEHSWVQIEKATPMSNLRILKATSPPKTIPVSNLMSSDRKIKHHALKPQNQTTRFD